MQTAAPSPRAPAIVSNIAGADASTDRRRILMDIAKAGLEAVCPGQCLPGAVAAVFRDRPEGRTLVFGAGKAAAAMAAAFEAAYPWPVEGLVVTRHGFGQRSGNIEVAYGAHPIPDQAGLDATLEIMRRMRQAKPGDRVVFLLSGGASALLTSPVLGISHQVKQEITRALVLSGAPIQDINLVRSRLSQVKGGGLARLCPQPVTTFAISDVVGDDPAIIGSGPTVQPSPEMRRDPLEILRRHRISYTPEVLAALSARQDSATASDRAADRYLLVANAEMLIDAASRKAAELGLPVQTVWPDLEGDVVEIATRHKKELAPAASMGHRSLIISGGELTVKVSNASPAGGLGLGGPNQEFVVAFGMAYPAWLDFAALAIDTDGVDGVGDAAGGYLDRSSFEQARANGIDPRAYLARHDSQGFLGAVDGIIRTGPTGTNVNDLRLILAEPASPGRRMVLDPDCD